MSKDVAKFVKDCNKCLINKVKPHTKVPLVNTETPQRPFDLVIIDTVGPVGPLIKSVNNNQYVLTMICDLSKYLIAIPMSDKSAKTLAMAIFEHFILNFGPMKSIRTDLCRYRIQE